jgi:putative phage-type endonuclease
MIQLASREDWLNKRKSYVGGSEASALVGCNPYMTNIDLYRIKTGQQARENTDNKDYVIYGHNAEPHLRELFALDYPEYKVGYVDNNMWLNDRYPFAHASLDGWLTDRYGRKGILEIKTTNILQSMLKEKWDHRIPDNYYCQVLWYLGVTELNFAILKAQLKYDYDGDVFLTTKHYYIDRADVEEDITYLMQRGETFAGYIEAKKEPPLVINL